MRAKTSVHFSITSLYRCSINVKYMNRFILSVPLFLEDEELAYFLKKILFRERGWEGERDGEKH